MPQKQPSDLPAEENSAAFKHLFGPSLINRLATAIHSVCPEFNVKRFKESLSDLTALEMKARVHLIRDTLVRELPGNYSRQVRTLLSATIQGELEGFALWPFTEFIQTFGLEKHAISLNALKKLTVHFTAEWGVRPFLRLAPQKTLLFLRECARDKNKHIRRWASEGSRPRLPWGERLNYFITEPELTLPILELLKYDPELYVRKSIANHLNDISRDNPAVALRTLRRWLKTAPPSERDKIAWITRHSMRTLIKSGNPAALKLIGVRHDAAIKICSFKSGKTRVSIDERYSFQMTLESLSSRTEKLVVDYILHYARARGKSSAKVFKLKTVELAAGARIELSGTHHFREVTTRRHYSGSHRIEIQVNGRIVKSQLLTLNVENRSS